MLFPLGHLKGNAPAGGGSVDFDSGSGNWTVPTYTTLTIELWGGGGGGEGFTGSFTQLGTAGTASICSGLSLNAGGGMPGNGAPASSGGVATGGTTNTPGENGQGQVGNDFSSPVAYRYGGASPNGGARKTGNTPAANGSYNGLNGNAPGGGATGAASVHTSFGGIAYGSGAGGGYVSKTYTVGAGGSPAIGGTIAYFVGPGGGGGGAAPLLGGTGGNGRIRFTWT